MRFLYLLCLLPLIAGAQQPAYRPEQIVRLDKRLQADVEAVSAAMMATFPQLKPSYVGLRLISEKRSALGIHYLFSQTYKGIPLFGNNLRVNLDQQGNVISVVHNLEEIDANTKAVFTGFVQPHYLLKRNNALIPVNRSGDCLVDEQANCVQPVERKYYFQTDTPGSGKVFNHDPLTVVPVIYGEGGTYKHFNDSDYALLNDRRISVDFPVTLDSGVYKLESAFAVMADLDIPTNTVATAVTPVFDFTRNQPGFKDVMAYYHTLRTRDYYMSLGFTNRMQYKIRIDSHSGTGDQSFFSLDDSTLNFGTGGIPDAEDADVICHEYTHALSFDINPLDFMANERRAIEEGMCDVIAAILSYKTTPFNWRLIYNFDGPNPVATGVTGFWGGRNGQSGKTYLDVHGGNPYSECDVWTSAMLDVAESIGHDTLAIVMLNSIHLLGQTTKMPEAAQAMLTADSLLFNGRHKLLMGYWFNRRNFGTFPEALDEALIPDHFRMLNTSGFASGEADAIVHPVSASPYSLSIVDAGGRVVFEQHDVRNDLRLNPQWFKQGIYFGEVKDASGRLNFKLIRY